MKNLYNMKLHENSDVNDYLTVMRVPGGWIYNRWGLDGVRNVIRTSVFVPFDNEFQDK